MMKLKHPILMITLPLLLVGASCGHKPSAHTSAKAEKPSFAVPHFNADSAYQYTSAQVAFGPRVPNTDAHTACADYLSDRLRAFGADVIVQEAKVRAFDNSVLNIKNIIGQFQVEKNDRVLLFAHWDSRPFADHDPDALLRDSPIDGANDGAGSVGILLEISRHLADNPTYPGVDIIFFDAEDYGIPDHREVRYKAHTWCLGSQHWGRNPHRRNYYARYGVLLDMVGAPDAQFYREQYSMEFAPALVDRIWNTAAELGYGQWFNSGMGGMIIDDHIYVYEYLKIPCINIIQHDPATDTRFGFYWHTHSDTMENIDRNTLKAVGQTVMDLIYKEK